MTVDRKFRLNDVRLCSMSITVISTLLRTVPHLDGTSVLSTLCNCICVFPLALPSKVPEAQHKSLNQTRTASMLDTMQSISGHCLLIPKQHRSPILMSSKRFKHLNGDLLRHTDIARPRFVRRYLQIPTQNIRGNWQIDARSRLSP